MQGESRYQPKSRVELELERFRKKTRMLSSLLIASISLNVGAPALKALQNWEEDRIEQRAQNLAKEWEAEREREAPRATIDMNGEELPEAVRAAIEAAVKKSVENGKPVVAEIQEDVFEDEAEAEAIEAEVRSEIAQDLDMDFPEIPDANIEQLPTADIPSMAIGEAVDFPSEVFANAPVDAIDMDGTIHMENMPIGGEVQIPVVFEKISNTAQDVEKAARGVKEVGGTVQDIQSDAIVILEKAENVTGAVADLDINDIKLNGRPVLAALEPGASLTIGGGKGTALRVGLGEAGRVQGVGELYDVGDATEQAAEKAEAASVEATAQLDRYFGGEESLMPKAPSADKWEVQAGFEGKELFGLGRLNLPTKGGDVIHLDTVVSYDPTTQNATGYISLTGR